MLTIMTNLKHGRAAQPELEPRPRRRRLQPETEVAVLYLPGLGEAPLLVAAGPVAAEHADDAVGELAEGVEAVVQLSDGAEGEVLGVGDLELGVDVVEEPLEGLALQVLTQVDALRDAGRVKRYRENGEPW